MGRTADEHSRARSDIEDLLHDALSGLEPDPLFRRRLRSDVMNAWVAAREGIGQPMSRHPQLPRRMGTLGRACLYASVLFATTVASVMGASSQALPGEALYTVKLRLEELRVDILPSEFHDELAVDQLAERIEEMKQVAATRGAAEAAAMLPPIQQQYAALLDTLDGLGVVARSDFLLHRLGVVAGLVQGLPADLRILVAGVMPGLPLTLPLVPDKEEEPAPTPVPAAPATPAPTPEPPTTTNTEPTPEPAAPAAQPEPGRPEDETPDAGGSDDDDESDGGDGGDDSDD
jgi:cell division septation protein DedD